MKCKLGFISITLCIALLLGILSGCGNNASSLVPNEAVIGNEVEASETGELDSPANAVVENDAKDEIPDDETPEEEEAIEEIVEAETERYSDTVGSADSVNEEQEEPAGDSGLFAEEEEESDEVTSNDEPSSIFEETEETSFEENSDSNENVVEMPETEEPELATSVEPETYEEPEQLETITNPDIIEEQPDELSEEQKNSIAMLNYLTVLTQEITSSKESRLFLEEAYSSLINNTYPNAVDVETQAEVEDLLDSLEAFRMISVKRDRLQYIYDYNKVHSLRSAIPNPLSILSTVNSKDLAKTILSILFMAVDSVSSYYTYMEQNELQYLKDGWELDDEESAELHRIRSDSFSYMINMVRENSLPGDMTLNENAVKQFVNWKNTTNVTRRIELLENSQNIYSAFGPYWLELARSYCENGLYEKCLGAISRYESINSRIFRKDYEYAKTLPYVILAAKAIYNTTDYETVANNYLPIIMNNTEDRPESFDWASRYYVASVYMDLYSLTKNGDYLDSVYSIAKSNVSALIGEQLEMNRLWLNEVQQVIAERGATEQEKKDVEQYNKLLKEERKTALPPISEPLLLNCELLFSMAKIKNISRDEKNHLDALLHENGEPLFLVAALDNAFRFSTENDYPKVDEMPIKFDGRKVTLPAYAVSANAKIIVTLTYKGHSIVFNDWTIEQVSRPQKENEFSFEALFTSEVINQVRYEDGTTVRIDFYPREEMNKLYFSAQFVAHKESWNIANVNSLYIGDQYVGYNFERVWQ